MKLECRNICKSFSGKQILKNVNMEVESGRAMGFLGRNGAGKTTTIRALMDVFEPDSGEFLLDGKPFDVSKNRVGYLPEERGMYAKEPILDQLVYFGRLRGYGKKETKQSAMEWIERFQLSDYQKMKLETLSKGNQQKIQIAQAFLNEPDILILDEPFSGLDPVNSQVLKDIIVEQIQKGKLVIFSSHQMSYVEDFCDDISLIDRGEIVLSGSLTQIKRKLRDRKIRLSAMDDDREQLIKVVRQIEDGIEITEDRKSLIIKLPESLDQTSFLTALLSKDVKIESFLQYEPSLQDIFIQEVGEAK